MPIHNFSQLAVCTIGWVLQCKNEALLFHKVVPELCNFQKFQSNCVILFLFKHVKNKSAVVTNTEITKQASVAFKGRRVSLLLCQIFAHAQMITVLGNNQTRVRASLASAVEEKKGQERKQGCLIQRYREQATQRKQ
jgi:hypothetical protein